MSEFDVYTQGTLRAAPNFNAENDSRTLRKAMKRFGTDEKAIIDILGYRTNAQRQQLRSLYKTCFGRDLIADLKSELSSHFERAYELKRAMKGMGTDEHALIEILCSRSNQEIRNINEFYKRMFNSKLEQGLMNETSGHFRRLLVSMCNAGRMENQPVDINKAKQDAQTQGTLRAAPNFNAENDSRTLRKAMKGFGTDEKAIIDILGYRTNAQRQQLRSLYKTCFGRAQDLIADLKSELSSHFERAYELKRAMRGMGTDEHALIEILCSRSNQEIRNINEFYKRSTDEKAIIDILGYRTNAQRQQLRSLYKTCFGRAQDLIADLKSELSSHFERAYELKRAMRGMGTDEHALIEILCSRSNQEIRNINEFYKRSTDEKAIIDILGYRTNAQRQQLRSLYKTCFGRAQDLIADLKSELSSHFERAYELKRAMRGMGTDEHALIEILCSRSNQEIRNINEFYKRMFNSKLEQGLMNETSGHFRRLLVSMCNSLYQAGEKQLGTDESMFNMIIASQSFPQLRAVFSEYKNVSGHDLDKAIGREFSGDIERGLRTIIQCVRDIPSYFADRLYHSMKGAGTDDQTLVRIVVTRCEVDMVQIKQVFQHKYGQSLENFLRDAISGDYHKMILALVGGSWPREDLSFKMLRLD